MPKRLSALVLLLLALAGGAALTGARPSDSATALRSPDVTAHEWGTFTSVAGPDGRAVEWRPFSGPSDLPRFVTILNPASLKIGSRGYLFTMKATVRMETPVIYFYSPREQTVSVNVRFPHGLITEWYPQAIVPPVVPASALSGQTGGIRWNSVTLAPASPQRFPADDIASHYYAARETDAVPVRVGQQDEKFLFYRGMASFPIPVTARIAEGGRVAVENVGADDIGLFVLFEKRGARLGYRVVRGSPKAVTLERPALTGDFTALRHELETALTEQGLYPREACAMVETWRDSWFEEGLRLFYLVPQSSVDAILPLEIAPRPAETARVFVGRLEIITPEMQTEVEHAIRANDLAALRRHGRFLEPIAESIQARFAAAAERSALNAALQAVAAPPAPAVQVSANRK